MAPRETENNAYAKFGVDKQRALWYVMVFLEWSIVVLKLGSLTVFQCSFLLFVTFEIILERRLFYTKL